ncbi:uncharacterized protein LOC134541372 [Bacillus rossius redtenbacheri]|uniref:uncharacterized protein LOC134541372 n=1 Tax=Bacillus rossius redtenbacheri TaxID=93214 RepID=UPI002FDCD1F7
MPWPEFVDRLTWRFNIGQAIVLCTSQFYGEHQRDEEQVELFIAHKVQLFRRIAPNTDLTSALPTITTLLRDELQPFLHSSQHLSVEDYVQQAVATEKNLQKIWRPTLGQLFQLQDHLLRIPVEVNGLRAAALVDTGASHVFITPSLVPPGALRLHHAELRLATTTRPGVTVGQAEIEISVEAALAGLGRAKVFSTLDLKAGYWQVPIRHGDREKTAFTIPDGWSFQFRAMPFGLKCAPATFQEMMTRVLEGYLGQFAMAYLDDVIVFSETWEDHVQHLALVLEWLATHHLTVASLKCHIGASKVEFLGHVVDAAGNRPQPSHLRKIAEAEVPRTRKQLQRFIGLVNWLRSYVPNFS